MNGCPLIKADCQPRYRIYVKASIGKYDDLDKAEKAEILQHVRTYTPSDKIRDWAESVFNDLDEFHAKRCMLDLQEACVANTDEGQDYRDIDIG